MSAGLIAGLAGCVTKPHAESPSHSEPPAASAALNSPPAAVNSSPRTPPIKEPTGALTLREALALALTENPELAPFAWQARANEARILQAGLRLNPELGFAGGGRSGHGQFQRCS